MLHPRPSHCTFLQWLPLKLRRKFQISCPHPKALPTSQFSSSDTLSLSHSCVSAFMLPSNHPLHSHFGAFALFFPFGMIYHMASFYYSGLGSNITSSDQWSLIIQPTSYTALLHYPTSPIFCNSPYTEIITNHLCCFVYYLSPSHQKVSCVMAFSGCLAYLYTQLPHA